MANGFSGGMFLQGYRNKKDRRGKGLGQGGPATGVGGMTFDKKDFRKFGSKSFGPGTPSSTKRQRKYGPIIQKLRYTTVLYP